jgi:hypothetical protein
LTLEFESGTIEIRLIEEKIDFGFAGVYPNKRCARCVNVAIVARNVSRQERNGPQRSPRFYIIVPALYQE